MFTIKYKDWFIQGYFDKPQCQVILPRGGLWATVKSLHSAKVMITKDSKWVKDKTE
jgi:hypothetical protein